ncbi:MAG: thioredoxin [Herbinix sp.]|jgi:peptide methionine sulfoxide reductase msrA/msrB|nr:thioredoxin [Herbinix sp.]
MKTIKLLVLLTIIILTGVGCSKLIPTTNTTPTDQIDESSEVDNAVLASENRSNLGDPAPAFELLDIAGKEHKLNDYADKKVYIKFWASWCPICLAGLEELNTLAGEDEDFIILTVVSPGYKNEKKKDAFITWFEGVENVSNLNVLLDEDGSLAKALGLRGYPTSAFIGSDGILVKTQSGHVANDMIEAEFENIY